MKGDKEVIRHFNNILTNELTAINQYFLHSRMFKDWGYEKLGSKEYEESIDEMKHADKLIERILFLDGIPNVQEMHKIMIGEEPVECLKCDFQIEVKAIPDLKGMSINIREVKEQVLTEIDEKTHVLIVGETGTGKGVVASAIWERCYSVL